MRTRKFFSNGAAFCVKEPKLVKEHPLIWDLLNDIKFPANYFAEFLMCWGQMDIMGVCLIDITEGSESASIVFFSLDGENQPCNETIEMYVADRYTGGSLFYSEAVEAISDIMLRDLAKTNAGRV